ncbi:MAG: NAD-binding protein [Cyanobacteriota bacterium]|nr:NAD-binding protein [Cyanobacteriota bacterium]
MDQPRTNTNVLLHGHAVNAAAEVGHMLIFGGGYTGLRFGSALNAMGVPVTLTHRQASPPTALDPRHWVHWDGSSGGRPAMPNLEEVSHVLVTIPPDGTGNDTVLPLLRELRWAPRWVGVLSTTGVYGDHGGRWVGEGSPVNPTEGRSQARVICEEGWRQSSLPVQVFRLPAIYGPGRSPFQALRDGKARLIHKPGQVFSRIHVDDIVGALLHCLALPARERPATLNLADQEPCPSSETLGYAAHLLDCRLPPVERFTDVAGTLSPMARSFWMENRRADSRLLREQLGYQLRYPSYREGYREGCGADWEPDWGSPREGMLRS